MMSFVILYFFLEVFLPSPKTAPHGCNPSIRSKIILTIAKNGMLKNMPEIPQSDSPTNRPIKVNKALIFTFEPTTRGRTMLASMAWIIPYPIRTISVLSLPVAKEIRHVIKQVTRTPMYGMMFRMPVRTPKSKAYLMFRTLKRTDVIILTMKT